MIWHLVLCILSRHSTQTRSLPWQDFATSSVCETIVAAARFFFPLCQSLAGLSFLLARKKKRWKEEQGCISILQEWFRSTNVCKAKKKRKKTENVKNCVQFKDVATRNRWCKTKVVTWMFLAPSVKDRQK